MSKPERRTKENGCELEPYTNWPLILGAITFVVVGVGTLGAMAGVTAITAAPKAVYRWAMRADTPVARAVPKPQPRVVAPASAPVVEEPEAPARSVVVESIELLGKPRIETAASLALERMTFDRGDPIRSASHGPRLNLVTASEEQLTAALLAQSKEIDIGDEKGLLETLAVGAKDRLAKAKRDDKKMTDTEAGFQTIHLMTETEAGYHAISDLVGKRADLSGLPLVDMKDCALSAKESKALSLVSAMRRLARADKRASEARERHGSTATLGLGPAEVVHWIAGGGRGSPLLRGEATALSVKIGEEGVRPLSQVFSVQPEKSRLGLIEIVASSKSGRSARALVQFAVFDLSARVREEAVKQLPSQNEETVRAELLAAFRHPWAPAAVHAAKAADRLDDTGMIPELKKLLDQPDPNQPFQQKGTWYVRELVRVNHLKNCLLCHPPAGAERSTLIAPVPLRDREIPVVYYASRVKGIPLVNASTIYLRQDFSVLHTVKDAKPWPEIQRFDYLVRTRPLGDDEIPKKAAKAETAISTYPQREAVRALLDVLERKAPNVKPRSRT